MNIPLTLQIIFIIVTFILSLVTTLKAKSSEPQRYLSVAAICSFIGMLGYYGELTSKTMLDAYRACKLEYIGYIVAPFMVLCFVSLYDESKSNLIIRRLILIADIVTAVLVATCEKNGLYYKRIHIVRAGGNSYITVEPGPMYYFYIGVMIIWAISALSVSYRVYKRYRSKGSHAYFYLFIAIVVYISGWVIARMNMVGYYDLSALDCVISMMALTHVTFRFGLFDTVMEAKNSYINGMDEGILVTNLGGRPIYANPEMKKIFDNIDWNSNVDIVNGVVGFLRENENGFLLDDHYYSWRESFTHNKRGKNEGRVYYIFDISDTYNYTKQLLEMKDKAVKANQLKNYFISNVSHEIRTPINSILGMNELIARENSDPDISEYSYNIREAGKNLLSLANDILDMSRMEAGKIEIHNSEYDIAVLVNDCLQMVYGRIEEKGLSFTPCVSYQMPTSFVGDEIRLKQCIINFLTNAIKYTDKGSITLNVDGVRKDDGKTFTLCVSVTDTGRGIKEEDLNKLFNPFVRFEDEKNRNIEGAGLGLSLTKQMIDIMHGNISVHSIYGVGSSFTVEIPQTIADEMPLGDFREHLKHINHDTVSTAKKFYAPDAHILIVDDNEVNREVAEGLMKPLHMNVDKAAGGRECLHMVESQHYDIIFMDHMMPEMDGIQTVHEFKKLSKGIWKDTAVIALTANASSDARNIYLREGFSDYMMKPIDMDILYGMIEKYLPKDMIKYY